MARSLILAVGRGIEHGHWGTLLGSVGRQVSDEAKMEHWSLIEMEIGPRSDGSPRTGRFRVRGAGVLFARNQLRVRSHVVLGPKNAFEGFEGEWITIADALGTHFDYGDLMAESTGQGRLL